MRKRNRILAVGLAALLALGWGWGRQRALACLPASGKVVVLDPGHGGWDPGKTGNTGANEKDVNLRIALRVQEYLEAAGAVVLLTRNADGALSEEKTQDLQARVELAEEGDIFVSIHQNAYPSAGVKGAQTFYHEGSAAGQALAECVQARLVSEADPQNHRLAKSSTSYYILKNITVPGTIVECGFLSNPAEEAGLNDPAYQSRIAWALYLGILDYFRAELEAAPGVLAGILEYFRRED